MKAKIGALLQRYREQLCYLVVSCATTAVNYLVYAFLSLVCGINYLAANVVAWIAAVAFSYFANGIWVYRSTARRGLREAGEFAFSRLFSLGVESVLLLVLVELAGIGELIAKLLVAVVVVVLNYLTGLLVFKRKH